MTVRVALDTSYAGTNLTGVGLYSKRLADELRAHQHQLSLKLTCYGGAARGRTGKVDFSPSHRNGPRILTWLYLWRCCAIGQTWYTLRLTLAPYGGRAS